jgi:thioredoxin 1
MALHNTTTKDEFEEKVLKSKKVVLVDFWAEWCPPCLAMAPTLEKLAKEMDENVDVVKVNIEKTAENGQLATEHNVQSIPNMLVFKDGNVVNEVVGLVSQQFLEDVLKPFV